MVSKTSSGVNLSKFSFSRTLKLFVSILTFFAEVWLPNKARPLTLRCAAICAGPVSFETTNDACLMIFDKTLFMSKLLLY